MSTSASADPASLELSERLRARLEAWSQARYPREACGLLIGRREGRRVRVRHAREARNLEAKRAHERYELDPADHLAAEDLARSLGLTVVGVWHSHPDHPPVPSENDRTRAWEGWSYLIVSVGAGAASELRSWRLAGARFVEEQVTVDPRSSP